jgi:hypothetical protein
MWMRDSLSSRVPFQLFADRAGEQDDDYPDFVGLDNVVEVALDLAADKFTVRVWASEKRYFAVELTPAS